VKSIECEKHARRIKIGPDEQLQETDTGKQETDTRKPVEPLVSSRSIDDENRQVCLLQLLNTVQQPL